MSKRAQTCVRRGLWSSISSNSSLPQNKILVVEKDGGRDWNQDDGEWTHDGIFNSQERCVYGYEGMDIGMFKGMRGIYI